MPVKLTSDGDGVEVSLKVLEIEREVENVGIRDGCLHGDATSFHMLPTRFDTDAADLDGV